MIGCLTETTTCVVAKPLVIIYNTRRDIVKYIKYILSLFWFHSNNFNLDFKNIFYLSCSFNNNHHIFVCMRTIQAIFALAKYVGKK